MQKILAFYTQIRFTGKIVDEELVSTARKDDIVPCLTKISPH
ncbi:MAG: hypothetical protein ACYDAJ_04575 [Nitrosotalea sp.]